MTSVARARTPNPLRLTKPVNVGDTFDSSSHDKAAEALRALHKARHSLCDNRRTQKETELKEKRTDECLLVWKLRDIRVDIHDLEAELHTYDRAQWALKQAAMVVHQQECGICKDATPRYVSVVCGVVRFCV